MKTIALLFAIAFAAGVANADSTKFEATRGGALPRGWKAGITGPGQPQWAIIEDATAPSPPTVLAQSGKVPSHSYPWCVDTNIRRKDGFVEVKFKPVSGKEDQAGGVIWRWQDGDNYYIARANALEDNIIFFRTEKGVRKELRRVEMKVTPNEWHLLRVEFYGPRVTIAFDGRIALKWADAVFTEAGAAGVWTKADSVTFFDDFRCDVDP